MPDIRIIFVGALALLVVGFTAILVRSPRNDRNWIDALERPPVFEKNAANWLLRDLRAFEFEENGASEKAWRDETIDPEKLSEIWFFVEPFEAWDGVAHSFLSFVFDGDDAKTISVSVEARREVGETYSGFKGVFNNYELIYIWSTEKDILTRIAVDLDHDLYAYKLSVTHDQAEAILSHFIGRTNALAERARFYNTLFSNCTNELAKAVNGAFPGALPWHFSHVLTGRSGERLHSLGFLSPEAPSFASVKEDANIRHVVKFVQEAAEPDFSEQWRQHVKTAQIEN